MPLIASVVVCSHNPRPQYLVRVLEALKNQELPKDSWELLLIDNASAEPLDRIVDLTWHPQAECIREDELGLTLARLRGIREARSDLVIFVDDDNVLDTDYLAVAAGIGADFPFLGAWGGNIHAEFEHPAPEWTSPLLGMLAIRQVDFDTWSNFVHKRDTLPWGAGLCVRRRVCEEYAQRCRNNSVRMGLGRCGVELGSFEDCDLAFTACDLGLGNGLFKALRLTHLIPAARLEEDYLVRLAESIAYCDVIFTSLRNPVPVAPQPTLLRRAVNLVRLWKMNPKLRRVHLASHRGRARALAALQQHA